ncbi:polysaccharide deacetylase family protein [Massilia niabensis]|uniref:NodB homology domain-containing protein n=1 Tax=Massilia niabensis TaxID=544910 RepID=A0ABW0KXX3_9BURK
MSTAKFVISLDFELFWGVSDTQTVAGYGQNVLGEWQAIPRLLALFSRHGVSVTWATVGMLMCRDYKQWRDLRPAILPGYMRANISPYFKDGLVRENAKLFFARPLVEQILATKGQELATHTYSHFYCKEAGATPDQFSADLDCARTIAADMGVKLRSIVLPRNQIDEKCLSVLPRAGIQVYRGNPEHWLYKNGDAVAGGIAGRVARFADACISLSGQRSVRAQHSCGLVNVPASLFMYPWSPRQRALSTMRLHRLKQGITRAAQTGSIFHLWWHPHNFGVNIEQNLAMLEQVLRHYRIVADIYGMQSQCMGEFAPSAGPASRDAGRSALPDMAVAAGDSMQGDRS